MTASRASWPDVPLGEVCDFKYGKSLPESARTGGDVTVFGSNGQVGMHDQAITAGPTIVIGRKGSFGEVNFSPSSCWPIDTTYFVDGTATKADLRWLAYRLASLGLNKMNKAAAVPGLNRDDAYRQRLLLPPLSEQRRIAEILDKADALRAKRRAAITQLGTLTESIFLDMFGDPIVADRGWPVRSIEAVAASDKYSIVDGPFGSSIKPGDYRTTGVPVVRIANITKDGCFSQENLLFIEKNKFDALKRSSIAGNDVLISRVGTLGNTCIFPHDIGDALLSTTGVCKITLDQDCLLPAFLHAAIRLPSFQLQIHRSASTSVQKYFNLTALRNWKIIVPPVELQREFARRVTFAEDMKATHRTSLIEMGALFASLQHRAFRGDL